MRISNRVGAVLLVGLSLILAAALHSSGISQFGGGSVAGPTGCKNCVAGPDVTLLGGFNGAIINAAGLTNVTPSSTSTQVTTPLENWIYNWGGVVSTTPTPQDLITVTMRVNSVGVGESAVMAGGRQAAAGGFIASTAAPLHMFPGLFLGISSSPNTYGPVTFNRGVAWATYGVRAQFLYTGQGVVGYSGAPTVRFMGFGVDPNFGVLTESPFGMPIPCDGAFTALVEHTSAANPAGGTYTGEIFKNGTTGTGLGWSVPPSGAPGEFYGSGNAPFVAGDWADIRTTNNTGATTATQQGVAVAFVPVAPCRGFVTFTQAAGSGLAPGANYFFPYAQSGSDTTTESNRQGLLPDGGVAFNAFCLNITAPSIGPNVVQFFKNGVLQPLTVTITSGAGANTVVPGNGASFTFNAGDRISIDRHGAASGTVGNIGGCSFAVKPS